MRPDADLPFDLAVLHGAVYGRDSRIRQGSRKALADFSFTPPQSRYRLTTQTMRRALGSNRALRITSCSRGQLQRVFLGARGLSLP
jgi:hypothetical protein